MSKCSCVDVDSFGGEHAEFYFSKRLVSRKDHACVECPRGVLPGETYERVVAKWDGKWETVRTCANCLSVRDAFFCAGHIHGTMWDYLREFLADVDGAVEEKCLVSLTPQARIDVCDMIQAIWFDQGRDTAAGGGVKTP